ncbi:low specificity L-threonine aldolase [Emticicia sp. BO119]|uniref:threonine aldolase family protein n=1 Tax=Emticicia sp. BO119 TaxID=2757768 RepID=UPI0015F0A3F0|nr:GntG family PLP-dependent aldolase [Emticicia sp. BO119]MBA4853065.1 PLP-dependent transferase [Emticicia sp. BO119]
MFIDLRSDTVTKPTPGMKEAMFSAELGDDVFGDDPTIIALEEKAAAMFGMEAALFCASGTMTNQLAIRVHTLPGSEVICDKMSHIYLYEGGGVPLNSFSSLKLLEGDKGRINSQQVRDAINNPDDIHQPITRLVSLENTMNKGGGCYYELSEIEAIKQVCNKHQLPLHLDGARLFNALVETGETTLTHGQLFDSISICLSKGLGCPVGSLLIGKRDFVKKARRFRKLMGGGWRQAGFLAAAGIYALDNHIERLKEDHARAREIGQILEKLPFVEEIYPIDTNIVIFRLPESILATEFVMKAKAFNLGCVTFGKHLIRFVTHLDFSDEHLVEFEKKIKQISF